MKKLIIFFIFFIFISTTLAGVPKNDKIKNEEQTYQRLYLLPISLISAALCTNEIFEMNDIARTMDILKESENISDYKKLKRKHVRKLTLAIVYFTATIANTFIALEKIEISAENNKLKLSYSF